MPVEAFADLWKYLLAGRSWTGMVKNRRKNGEFYWVLSNTSPMWENGKMVGLTQVSDARQTIDSSIEAVQRVAALMAEISSSSIEQGLAIDRVAHLIVEIDQATQLNVPMAEGAAQSARALEDQGRDLLRTAGVFRLH